jgi:drug/metabolite transporter (DMT)-like permease
MDASVWASKRFWFGVAGAVLGALIVSFAGDPSVPGWAVKLIGALNAGCSLAVSVLQNLDVKAKKNEATRQVQAMP